MPTILCEIKYVAAVFRVCPANMSSMHRCQHVKTAKTETAKRTNSEIDAQTGATIGIRVGIDDQCRIDKVSHLQFLRRRVTFETIMKCFADDTMSGSTFKHRGWKDNTERKHLDIEIVHITSLSLSFDRLHFQLERTLR